MSVTNPLIEVEDLHFRYSEEDDWALQGVNLEVHKGEWLSVIGHNGSGKSTLAKCFNGLLFPEQGLVRVEGYNTAEEDELWEVRRRVGMVFQNPDNQFVGTTVKDDVAFGMENHGIPREVMVKRLGESLDLVSMSDYLDHEPHRLSGGQKQRVAIAGIIALQPSIIILDEATSMLDPQGRNAILDIMRRLNREQGITVISITHDLEEVLEADRAILMNHGEMIKEGTPEEIFSNPGILTSIGLDLPFTIKLRQALAEAGIDLPETVIRQNEMVEALWTLKSKI